MDTIAAVAAILLGAVLAGLPVVAESEMSQVSPITIENVYVKYGIGVDGRNTCFVDKGTGKDYAVQQPDATFAYVSHSGQRVNASAVSYADGRLAVTFGDSGVSAIIGVEVEEHYFTLEVLSVAGAPDELAIVDIPLAVAGTPEEPFAGCALALNLQTNVPEIPGPNKRLRAMCYPRFGFEGAKVAIIGSPQTALRDVMKEVVSAADDLPHSSIGGPWALDSKIGRGSYLFDFGALTEKTVGDWVALAGRLGMNQIDFHTGTSLRFGDCAPNPELFPNGRASVKAVIDALHGAGISAGLHTYAFFIDKRTPYVTPIPDPRLGKDATFTLAESLTADATVVPVVESTESMSTTTGFFVRNSVTLQIDDELITYAGISKEPPYAFTECTRGACGTRVAVHAAGAKVYHLKECFGLFAPDADSTLLEEVAKNTADTFNECGFDMIYLDALDGEDILGGGENAWHYGSKFVFEIANRLEKPALFEMSTFHHHLWYVRARMGAWDHPTRSHKRFIDVHCAANRDGRGMFLPMNLGWWAVKVWNDGVQAIQAEPTFSDDIEYLMCKCIGMDMGFSLMGVNPSSIDTVPAFQQLAPIFKQYEDLRHANYFPESIKARLRVPGDEFTLEQDTSGRWRLRPVQYDKHKVQGLNGWSNQWVTVNRFGAQPAQFRIEALMSAAGYDSPEGVTVEDFTNLEAFTDRLTEQDVSADLKSAADQVKTGSASGCYTASSGRPEPNGAWSKVGKMFSPPLNIAEQPALGVWIHGDGQGELLNVQLRSPHHTTSGGIGDHYVKVDFTGWRYFELLEMEGGHIADYAWPYGGAYGIYRESVDYGLVETLSLWYNNLPDGKAVTCYLSPIKALPLVKCTVTNPTVDIGGRKVRFPTEIETGCYLEFRSMSDCKVFGPKGELLREVTPEGEPPVLEAGENRVGFDSVPAGPVNVRAYVTVISRGEPLQE